MTNTFIVSIFLSALSIISGAGFKTVTAGGNMLTAAKMVFGELIANNPESMPSEEVFATAYRGYSSLKAVPGALKKDIITVIDFSLPSTAKRLWIIDLNTKKVLFNDYVAHGRNSGDDMAASFSNISGSYMSSIGFYITAETYHGKHGLSLRLEGMDEDFNSNARNRAIVMHGADYVSADFIKQHGRLGRSLGCPSVSMDIHEQVIDTIKDGSTLFIYFPDPAFVEKSRLLNPHTNQTV